MQGMPSWMKWTISILIGIAIIILGFRFAGWLLTAFFVMNCLVLIIVVLLQSGKAADLAGAFGGAGSQTAFGPRGAAILEKFSKPAAAPAKPAPVTLPPSQPQSTAPQPTPTQQPPAAAPPQPKKP